MSSKSRKREKGIEIDSVSGITQIPFSEFEGLKKAIKERKFSLGIDPLAAAAWADENSALPWRLSVSVLSLLLILAGVASIITALVLRNYWLLAAVPIQAVMFYLSESSGKLRPVATIIGIASFPVFVNLLLNRYTTAATLVAYCGLTFAAVRAAGALTRSAYRKALLADEAFFVHSFKSGHCTLRENENERVYAFKHSGQSD